MKKLIAKEIEINIFPFTLFFVCGSFEEENHKEIMEKLEMPESYVKHVFKSFSEKKDMWNGMCYNELGSPCLIWIPKYPKTIKEKSTLMHESIHATFYIFRWIGVDVNQSTEELFCYLSQYIFNECMRND